MAKVRRILIPASVEVAKRSRKCGRSKQHSIPPGGKCLVLKDPSSGYAKNYCLECAKQIVEQANQDLEEIEAALAGDEGSQ